MHVYHWGGCRKEVTSLRLTDQFMYMYSPPQSPVQDEPGHSLVGSFVLPPAAHASDSPARIRLGVFLAARGRALAVVRAARMPRSGED